MSDIVCTSSNAAKIVISLPREQKLLFAPDRYLARWVMKESGRDDMVYWPGTCIVHEIFSAQEIAKLTVSHPDAEVIVLKGESYRLRGKGKEVMASEAS